MTKSSRFRGALLGLAVGDAIGTTLEFRARGSFEPVTDMVGGGPFGLRPGQWTDDTSMALCLARSLLDSGGFDARDQMSRYVSWWRHGKLSSTGRCFDIGNTTRAALARFERDGNPFAGDERPDAAGNGSLMRLAPIALYFAGDPALAESQAAASSRTTHAAREAVDACRLFARLLLRGLAGLPRDEILAPGAPFDPPLAPAIEVLRSGAFLRKHRDEIRGTGYCVPSLEAALFCFARAGSFSEAVLAAANLGDDADTTAAIAGQIAGAHFGEEGIPRVWRERLHRGAEIARLADALMRAREAPPPPNARSYWANPGSLLAGAYPGSLDRDAARAVAAGLLDAGVTAFASLMQPHETDRQGRVFAPYEDIVRELAAERGRVVEFARFPIIDLGVPSDRVMRAVQAFIDERIAEGRRVYVHCWGGRGRTGTVVGAHLIRHGQADADDFAQVIARRRESDAGGGASPETAAQIEFVRRFDGGN